MKEDKRITQLKEDIQKWAEENSIAIFNADESSSLTSITSMQGLSEFKKLLLQVKPSFIILICGDIKHEALAYETYPKWFEENDADYLEHSAFLKANADELTSIEVGFVYQGVYFYICEFAEWDDEFEIISELVSDYNEFESEDEELNSNEGNGELGNPREEREDAIAKELAYSEEFKNSVNAADRTELLRKLMLKAHIDGDKTYEGLMRWSIQFKAEEIFSKEVKPELERKKFEEMKAKVLELKKQNFKKVQVASKLGVSTHTVNKYWEME